MRFLKKLAAGSLRLTAVATGRLVAYLGVLTLFFIAGVMARPAVEKYTPMDIQEQLGLEFQKKPEPMVIKFSGEHANKKNLVTIACFSDGAQILSFPKDFKKMLRSNLEWVVMVDVDVEPSEELSGDMSYLISSNLDGQNKPRQKTVSTPTLTIVNFWLPMSENRIMQGRITIRTSEFTVRMLPVEQVEKPKKEEEPKKEEPKKEEPKKSDDDF